MTCMCLSNLLGEWELTNWGDHLGGALILYIQG